MVRERPAEAEDRAVPGHWEGDLLTGGNDTHIATLIERHSRFTMLVKLPRKETTTVVAALAKHVRKPRPINYERCCDDRLNSHTGKAG
jgi:IS30 family transposase